MDEEGSVGGARERGGRKGGCLQSALAGGFESWVVDSSPEKEDSAMEAAGAAITRGGRRGEDCTIRSFGVVTTLEISLEVVGSDDDVNDGLEVSVATDGAEVSSTVSTLVGVEDSRAVGLDVSV